jgi:hypothetical protein
MFSLIVEAKRVEHTKKKKTEIERRIKVTRG